MSLEFGASAHQIHFVNVDSRRAIAVLISRGTIVRSTPIAVMLVVCSLTLTVKVEAGRIIEHEVDTDLVPGPVEVCVLLPDGYDANGVALPLLLYLHGGFADRQQLRNQQPIFDKLWRNDQLPKMVVATPTVGPICEYLDFQDGTQRWESFLVRDLLHFLRANYRVSHDRARTVVSGWSMGGIGALRLAFKHPDVFAGVAAFEPAIVPALTWEEVRPRNQYSFANEHFEALYGNPIDKKFWRSNNPAAIAHDDPKRLKESGLRIYIECGNRDYLHFHEGTKFLHDTLWAIDVPHGFHLVDRADHMDKTHTRRTQEGLQFLGRVVSPSQRDEIREKFRTWPELIEGVGPLPGQADIEKTLRIVKEWHDGK